MPLAVAVDQLPFMLQAATFMVALVIMVFDKVAIWIVELSEQDAF